MEWPNKYDLKYYFLAKFPLNKEGALFFLPGSGDGKCRTVEVVTGMSGRLYYVYCEENILYRFHGYVKIN